jgi:hypothetical protein
LEGKVEISITARSLDEARNILTGLAGKYKNLNIDETMKQAIHVEKEIIEPLYFLFSRWQLIIILKKQETMSLFLPQ